MCFPCGARIISAFVHNVRLSYLPLGKQVTKIYGTVPYFMRQFKI